MERYSLDSSVVVKWFNEEEGTTAALKLRDAFVTGEIELIVTQLLFCEVANTLRYKPDFNHEKLSAAMEALEALQMSVETIDAGLLNRAGEIAFDGGVTIYDAIPVAVAEKRKAICVTADEKTQYARLRGRYPVVLLRELVER